MPLGKKQPLTIELFVKQGDETLFRISLPESETSCEWIGHPEHPFQYSDGQIMTKFRLEATKESAEK